MAINACLGNSSISVAVLKVDRVTENFMGTIDGNGTVNLITIGYYLMKLRLEFSM